MDWVGNAPWPSLVASHKACIGGVMLFLDNARILANIIMSGLLDRFPSTSFVSVESGLGWVPFLLEALDYHYSEFGAAGNLQRRPSEYFATNFHCCFWFEKRDVSSVIARVGVDNVLFETDFPHPTCLYPVSTEAVAQSLGGLDEGQVRKVLGGNAAQLYDLPLA